MIFLFTDFGENDLYVGQLKATIAKVDQNILVTDLFHNAPQFKPFSSAILLSSLLKYIPSNSTVLAVVDPGVGSAQRKPVVVKTKNYVLVGPDNGLFDGIDFEGAEIFEITWRPKTLSQSFHGRDLFAPVAALIEKGEDLQNLCKPTNLNTLEKAKCSANSIIYIDSFGNCFSGITASSLHKDKLLISGDTRIKHANVFSDVKHGELFWYENSIGLAEIAANQESASEALNLKVGDRIAIK